MPYIKLSTNKTLTLQQEVKIKEKLGQLISIIPNKSEESLMVHMEDNQVMYFRGKEIPCMMIAIHLYKETDNKYKRQFTEELTKFIADCTQIKIEDQYLTFHEYPTWGMNGTLY